MPWLDFLQAGNMRGKMKYREDLSATENTAFVLLCVLPWLGILILVWRKYHRPGGFVTIHDLLFVLLSAVLWGFHFQFTDGVFLAVLTAAVGSLCYAVFLLLIEESRTASWSINVGRIPLVATIAAVLLPLVFTQLAGLIRGKTVTDMTGCSVEMQIGGVAVLLSIVEFVVSVRPLTKGLSMLDGYFDEFPDNETMYLIAFFVALIVVIVWPLTNQNVPNVLQWIVACALHVTWK